VAPDVANFGYVMPLRDPEYKGIVDLMARRVDASFQALATAGLQLADSFLQLHSRGLCYRDISFGNVFYKPASGDVLICDNDNVAVDGDQVGGVLGTPDFMAPEIVRGEAVPSSRTDLYSLAVLLFYMFHLHHPLFGKRTMQIHCLDLAARVLLCGKEPLFIFDPHDKSNEAVPKSIDPYGEAGHNALIFWPIYPQFLRDLFTQAFTEGLHDPEHGRVRESQWRLAMGRLRDSIVYCTTCSAESFYDADALQKSGGQPGVCWSCQTRLTLPPRIRIGKNVIMLNHDSRLYAHHLDERRPYAFVDAIGEVNRHPSLPNVWGLKNLTNDTWKATPPDGTTSEVGPGRSVTLAVGTKINFGNAEGEIRT
jgi:serine/threonine protein kinase